MKFISEQFVIKEAFSNMIPMVKHFSCYGCHLWLQMRKNLLKFCRGSWKEHFLPCKQFH